MIFSFTALYRAIPAVCSAALGSLPGGVPGKFLLPESQRVDDNASHVFTITRNVYLQTPLQIYLAGKGKLPSHQYYFWFGKQQEMENG